MKALALMLVGVLVMSAPAYAYTAERNLWTFGRTLRSDLLGLKAGLDYLAADDFAYGWAMFGILIIGSARERLAARGAMVTGRHAGRAVEQILRWLVRVK